MSRPTHLRIEHGPRPLGIGISTPRLSWWLPSGSESQSAYEIAATIDGLSRTSEIQESDRSILAPWPFDALASRTVVGWQVRVRTESGWSDWSAEDEFEAGLLSLSDWSARFIGSPETLESLPPVGHRPATYFQRTFSVRETPRRARIYATAQGIYELHLDGQRIGDLELTPGFTAYHTHLEYQTYDITDLLGVGDHTLTATVSDGWWRGATGAGRDDCCYGKQTALLAQLEMDTSDGRLVLGTDASWKVSIEGPIVAADLMDGEIVDQRIPFPPPAGWSPAQVIDDADPRLTTSPAPPTRTISREPVRSVTRLGDSRYVVDVGRNISGRLRLSGDVLGPSGNHVGLRHGESLDASGDVDTTPLNSIDATTMEPISFTQPDEVISSGNAEPFEPHHTTHGFQYVGVDGVSSLEADDVEAVRVHTDMERTGWFTCSDDRINRLHDAAVLSFEGNACEIPTDCPTRERSGWTGDWQLFIPSAAFLYDVAGFSTRWLRDLAADQRPDGRVANFAPDPLHRADRDNSISDYLTGSAGWGDAAIYVPYQIWQSYGDVDILRQQWPSMTAWIEFALRRAREQRHPSRIAIRPEPAPHEEFLWDVGFHWGEWCEPDADPMPILSGQASAADVATAYLYRSLATMATIGRLIGEDEAAATYDALAGNVRHAWQTEFCLPDGEVVPATQANLTRALAFDLVDAAHRSRVAADLVKLIRDAGTTIGTGFLATPFLLPVLVDQGYADVAYELLLQSRPPSWLYMIDSGASTIWENWEGLDRQGLGSLNHYSKGAVIQFLHEYVVGLRPVDGFPAYSKFEIKPVPGNDLDFAEARLHSPYGPIRCAWRREREMFTLDVTVPPGTEAEATLPSGRRAHLAPGEHRLQEQPRGAGVRPSA